MVSIMPGIETGAPERTETSRGCSASGRRLDPLQVVLDLAPQPGRELTALEIAVADVGGDGEAGRDGNAERGHLGEPGAFAAEHVLHGRGAIGAALAEEVDERLGERPAHAGVATSGEAWRSWASSFGIGVG
jgi:hypothetical protein